MRLVLVLWLAPAVATAQPGATEPKPPSSAAQGTLELAARVGYGPADFDDRGCISATGDAPFAEIEGGFRMPPYVIAGVFFSYGLLHSTVYGDYKVRYVDYGFRASATYEGAYAGIGLGNEDIYVWPIDYRESSLLVEAHGGYAIPITKHVAIDVRLLYGQATSDHTHTLRFSLGVQL